MDYSFSDSLERSWKDTLQEIILKKKKDLLAVSQEYGIKIGIANSSLICIKKNIRHNRNCKHSTKSFLGISSNFPETNEFPETKAH